MSKKIFLIMILALLANDLFAKDLSLDSCKAFAMRNNKRLKEARMKIEMSEKVKDNAYTNYFPKIEGGAVMMKSANYFIEGELPEMNLPVYDGNPVNLQNPTQFAYFPGMKLELLDYMNAAYIMALQPVYTGSRISKGNELAALAIELNKDNYKLTKDQILVKTEEYFWTLASLLEKRKTIDSFEKLLRNLEKDVKVAFDAGLVLKSDLLKVQLELNKIKANKLKLNNGVSVLKMALAQHIGIEYDIDFNIIVDYMPINTPERMRQDPNAAINNRNEYKMLEKVVEIEELQKDISFGEKLPQIAVGVQGLYMDMMDNSSTNLIGIASLSVPISDWWGASYKEQEHEIKIDIAKNNYKEKGELMIIQMEKNYRDCEVSFKQIEIAKISKKQASEHLRVVEDNYKAGIVNTSDYLEAQAMHQKTLDDLADAKADFKIKTAYYLMSVSEYK